MQTRRDEKKRKRELHKKPPASVRPEVAERSEVQTDANQKETHTTHQSPAMMKKGALSRSLLWCKRRFWDSWRFDDRGSFVEAVTSVVAIVGVCFLVEQWRQTNSALREARTANRIAMESSQLQHRAWVTVEASLQPTFIRGKPIPISFRIKSSGNTPAKRVVGCIHAQIYRKTDPPKFDLISKPPDCATFEMTAPVMIPNLEIPVDDLVVYGLDMKPLVAADDTTFESLKNDETYIAAFAFIEYRDIFDAPHWVKYCYASYIDYGPPGPGPLQCIDFNDIDTEDLNASTPDGSGTGQR